MRRRRSSAVVVLLAVMLAAALTPAAHAAAGGCTSFAAGSRGTDGDAAVRSALGTVGSKAARTTYFPGGVYRTTTCDQDGQPLFEVEMAPLALPDGTVSDLPIASLERQGDTIVGSDALRGDLRLLSGDWREAVDRAAAAGLPPVSYAFMTANAAPPTRDDAGIRTLARASRHTRGFRFKPGRTPRFTPAAGPPRSMLRHVIHGSRARAARIDIGNKCTQNSWWWHGWRWTSPYNYYTSFWGRIGDQYVPSFIQQTLYGHQTWMYRWNFCDWSQAPVIPTTDLGTTSLPSMTDEGSAGIWRNGMNIVDIGRLTNAGACTAAIACTRWWLNGGVGGTVTQTSMRLNIALPWTVGTQPGYYDIWSIVAHEAGHAIDNSYDLPADDPLHPQNDVDFWQIMFAYGYTNDVTKRVMGLGDYNMDTYLYSGLFY